MHASLEHLLGEGSCVRDAWIAFKKQPLIKCADAMVYYLK